MSEAPQDSRDREPHAHDERPKKRVRQRKSQEASETASLNGTKKASEPQQAKINQKAVDSGRPTNTEIVAGNKSAELKTQLA